MTILGVDMTDREPTHDYTGLMSGHRRPLAVEQAHDASIEAWAAYIAATDLEPMPSIEELDALRQKAFAADVQYQSVYDLWMLSMQDCTCRDDSSLSCPSCCARHALTGEEMPF